MADRLSDEELDAKLKTLENIDNQMDIVRECVRQLHKMGCSSRTHDEWAAAIFDQWDHWHDSIIDEWAR